MSSFVSFSSPGSSSYFHLGHAIPYIYQDFICRLRRAIDQDVMVVHSINQLGIRRADTEKYFKNIESLKVLKSDIQISDSSDVFLEGIRPYIKSLISKDLIRKRTCYVFTCEDCPQVFLASEKVRNPKLVRKKQKEIKFFNSEVGEVRVFSPNDLVSPTAICVPKEVDVNFVIGPNHETLPIVFQPDICKPTLFSQRDSIEEVDNKTLEKWNSLKSKDEEIVICNFCGKDLEPSSLPCWTIKFGGFELPDLVYGAISHKNVKQLYNEMSEEIIISRPRNDAGIPLTFLDKNIGIKDHILDPEFSLQFLPLVFKDSVAPINETYISETHIKFVTSSISLYQMLGEKPIQNFILLGTLLGSDKRPMRRLNNNVEPLRKLIAKWGIDVIRLAIADLNLVKKRSAVIENGHYKGWKRFLQKVTNVSHFTFEKCSYQKKTGNLLGEWLVTKNNVIESALKHEWRNCIRKLREFINIKVSKEYIPGVENNIISAEDLYSTLIDFLDILSIFAPEMTEELIDYGSGAYEFDTKIREKGISARIQYLRNL